jgi:hypothetical protein
LPVFAEVILHQQISKAMKTKIHTLLFLLICASFQVNSQSVTLCSENSAAQKISGIKSVSSKYCDGKVYLHLTVNGNIVTKTLAVERSLDGKNYEVIGHINILGTPAPFDLVYYFTDESPVTANLYYRLSEYSSSINEMAYSETTSIIPINNNNTKQSCGAKFSTVNNDQASSLIINEK